ncbi:MAG: hypothetical protein R6U17_05660 [Thermoplasmata archaeon]
MDIGKKNEGNKVKQSVGECKHFTSRDTITYTSVKIDGRYYL